MSIPSAKCSTPEEQNRFNDSLRQMLVDLQAKVATLSRGAAATRSQTTNTTINTGGSTPRPDRDIDELLDAPYPPPRRYEPSRESPFKPGMRIGYDGAVAPEGWAMCHGQALSRTDYADLFAAIGTQFGDGDGTTTFNLPDCRGRYWMGPKGADVVGMVVGNLDSVIDFTHEHDVGDLVTEEDGEHTHSITVTVSGAGAHSHGGATGTPASTTEVEAGAGATVASSTHTHGIASDGTHSHGASSSAADSGLHTHEITGKTAAASAKAPDPEADPEDPPPEPEIDIRPETLVGNMIIKL